MAAFKSVLLLGLLSTAFSTPTKRSTCQPGRQTINGVQFTISCGMDRPGGDYSQGAMSFDQCVSACASDANCLTAQYHEDSGFCYFKNSVNTPVIATGEDSIDLGVACQQSTTITFNGVQCSIQCGVDRPGGDYGNTRTENYLSCAAACAVDSNCVTAQYNERNGFCYFKNALNGPVSSDDTDSVVCTQSGDTTTTATTTTTTTTAAAATTTTTTNTTTPSPTTTTTTTPATTTTTTGLKGQGQSCTGNYQCADGYCTRGGFCGPVSNGLACGRNTDCISGYCSGSGGYYGGTCQNPPS